MEQAGKVVKRACLPLIVLLWWLVALHASLCTAPYVEMQTACFQRSF
jgi:hypothetical protein